jgi:hypothetical protein
LACAARNESLVPYARTRLGLLFWGTRKRVLEWVSGRLNISFSGSKDIGNLEAERKAELESKLPEDLRICAARIARAMYALRNKRNVAHKGQIDPNTIDLAFAHHGSSWIMAELLRNATGLSMQEVGELITLVHAHVGPLIEEIDGTHLVLAKVSVRVELLILLQSHYPSVLPVSEILKCLDRRNPRTVKVGIRRLYTEKLAHGTTEDGYRLTQTGHSAAVAEIRKLSENR